jgi:hypothetical protein
VLSTNGAAGTYTVELFATELRPGEHPLTFSSPLSRSTDTVSCPNCEVNTNKNAASGYAGLDSSAKLSAAQLPNPSASTLGGVQSIAAQASRWVNTISTSGVPSASQPAASDLSNGTTGTGTVVLSSAPTLSNPVISGAIGANLNLGTANALLYEIPNAGSTGTSLNMLAKLTGNPSTAVKAATTDVSGIVGVVVGGAGTSGNAQIAIDGVASCVFDNATVAGDYVTISSTTAGNCHDAGTTRPTSGQILGIVLSTNGASSTARAIRLFSAETPGTHPVPTSALVSTSQTTTSSSYTDLTTVGPSLTVNVSSSGTALVMLTAQLSNSNANRICYMGFAVSGASTVAASDAQSVSLTSASANATAQVTATYLVTGLTPGSNTFTAKYRRTNNTCTFVNRSIVITPY